MNMLLLESFLAVMSTLRDTTVEGSHCQRHVCIEL